MGKSGARKKKSGVSAAAAAATAQVSTKNEKFSAPSNVHGASLESALFLKRAHEVKEDGNKWFQLKDYAAALEKYDNALSLTPKSHPDRAVFHSNKAACLMQMKPIDYEAVIGECTMAIEVQPNFVRALLRRARAYEAVGKYELAMKDVQVLLDGEPTHGDALEIDRRLRVASGARQEAQQESRPSPAALGASAVRGAPVGGLGPCLPARPPPKKAAASGVGLTPPSYIKPDKVKPVTVTENGPPEPKIKMPREALKPSTGSSKPVPISKNPIGKENSSLSAVQSIPQRLVVEPAIIYRPLKLVYDHDIRLSQMPVNCSFKVLRELVTSRFPSSKAVLIKYKDNDGDLVTITTTGELRLAECCVDRLICKEPSTDTESSFGMLRLHVVEVNPEQEPPILEEEEEKPIENNEVIKENESGGESVKDTSDTEVEKSEKDIQKEKEGVPEETELKEVEMDDWLFEFAQLFRTHVGIDPDAHVDLHELGMELCSEAIEETVTSEEAQNLFDKAASKFQEVAALAFFNWGNVHMCAARKRIPLDESAGKKVMADQLQTAYDWVKDKYTLAKEKYEEALVIKPDFYEGLLALGQQQFEMAKLHWSFAVAMKIDFSNWDSKETLDLYGSAEEKMNAATHMWEKLEKQRAEELKNPSANNREEILKRKKKQGNQIEGDGEITADEAAEQAAAMRSQIHLFWGNMLFERSQVECKLGFVGWEKNLDAAVERFKLAGASEADISMVLKNHSSNANAVEDKPEKVENPSTDVSTTTQ